MSEVADVVMEDDSEVARHMIGKRICDKTKQLYRNKVNSIQKYIQQQFHVSADTPPLQNEHVLAFFGSLVKRNDETALSRDCVSNYNSALRWWYGEHALDMEPTLSLKLRQLLRGYKKTYAELKQSGKKEVFEGNSQMHDASGTVYLC